MREIIKNTESDDWKSLSKKEKEEITNYLMDNDLIDRLPMYKSMTTNEILQILIDNIITNEKLKIKLTIMKIIIYLKENNRYNSSFAQFNLVQLDNYITLNKGNDVYIDSKLFDFSIDNILLKIFNSHFKMHFLFLNKTNKADLNSADLDHIYQKLINHNEKQKVIKKTYLMTDASGFIKIGKAICLDERLTTFKTENPTIRIIAVINYNIKGKLHKIYSSKRIVGEWFDLSQNDVLDLINDYEFKVIK